MDITIEGLVLGLLAIGIGLAFAFYGLRIFLILLPIWGFLAGFLLGASATSALLGGADPGAFATVSGWVVGLIVGIAFAALSYLYYWMAIVLLGGALGYQATLGVFEWLNLNPEGWIAFIVALIVGALFAVAFFVLRMPAVLVIVATAISGAGAAVAGLVLALGLLPEESLNVVFDAGIFGIYALDDLSIVWLVAAVALAIAGAYYQTRSTADMEAKITEESFRNPGLDRTGRSGTAPA